MALYAIVHRKVDGPCREVTEYCRTKPTVHPAQAITLEDRFDDVWGEEGFGKDVR